MVDTDVNSRFSPIDHYWKGISSTCDQERKSKYQKLDIGELYSRSFVREYRFREEVFQHQAATRFA